MTKKYLCSGGTFVYLNVLSVCVGNDIDGDRALVPRKERSQKVGMSIPADTNGEQKNQPSHSLTH